MTLGSTEDTATTTSGGPGTSGTTVGAEGPASSTGDDTDSSGGSTSDGTTGDGLGMIEYCTIADLPIPDNDGGGVSSDIGVDLAGGGIVQTVELVIVAAHSYVGDLRFDLRKGEMEIVVIDHPGGGGCDGDDIDVQLHDAASDAVGDACMPASVPALSGELRPQLPLNPVFFNQQMLGTWRLRATDDAGGDSGVLQQWCLRFTYR
ncbi:MAG: proprotein convertase P-domain-containing protein [Myxococcota bacterium]